MAKPTDKAPAIDQLIKDNLGIDRKGAITHDKCSLCHGDAIEFRDELSKREYCISGMCQECQDRFFGVEV